MPKPQGATACSSRAAGSWTPSSEKWKPVTRVPFLGKWQNATATKGIAWCAIFHSVIVSVTVTLKYHNMSGSHSFWKNKSRLNHQNIPTQITLPGNKRILEKYWVKSPCLLASLMSNWSEAKMWELKTLNFLLNVCSTLQCVLLSVSLIMPL